MQDKHFVIIHCKEDRDIFINKCKYPKTVYHVGNDPQPDDVHLDPVYGTQTCLALWIIDNYDKLPDYVIFTQADPTDHVHEPLLAFESTLTGKWGSFCYGRSLYDQYSLCWCRINPIRNLAHDIGLGFHNDNNSYKSMYQIYPGEIMYMTREKILEKPKSFYEYMVKLDLDNKFVEYVNQEYPPYVKKMLDVFHPNLKHLSFKEKIEHLTSEIKEKPQSLIGWSWEALWQIIWADNDLFNLFNQSQMCLGNKLYFDTSKEQYDLKFKFEKFPFSENQNTTSMNLRLFENDWFDWNCPNYLKWRKTLVEKTIWEGEQRGFDGRQYLRYLEQCGYKHISL